jgi:NAD(P)-dependent dehydrogenase (short-subunit alcohol dehydrogenase family)
MELVARSAARSRAFAREGARVFRAGRTLPGLEVTAGDIARMGVVADVAEVDAFDEQAIDAYLREVVHTAGRLDISFNAVSFPALHGLPLVEMAHQDYLVTVMEAVTTHFLTATAAARHMARQRAGVILAMSATAGRGYPSVGGFGVACAAIEAFCRQLAVETGSAGVRVICLRSAGSPDAPGVEGAFEELAAQAGVTRAAFEARQAEKTVLKRLPKVAEIANMAALLASDHASAMTGAIANVTCGELVDA